MASFKFYLLSAMVCGVLIVGQGAELTIPRTSFVDLPTEHSTPETSPQPIPSSTDITTKTSPTSAPTPSTPTTPTTASDTTTSAPDTTTTSAPNTTTTSTTTPAPTTTTPAPPKPVGPPDQGLWSYTDDQNHTCVIVQFAAQLNVTYYNLNTTPSEVFHVIINVPANASVVSGNCNGTNGTEQWLTIGWSAPANQTNTLTVKFARNDSTSSYEMKSLNVSLAAALFPKSTNLDPVALNHGVEWKTPLASSYRCTAPTELNMDSELTNFAAKLTLSRLQEEAFRKAAGKGFSAARDCAGGDIPDAVPIAVGCALGGMVVVVLIAYLVARRRSAARGYLSM